VGGGGSGSGSAMSSVRRNLFQNQLTRRPTSGAPGSASSGSIGVGGGPTPSSSSVSLASSVGGDALRLDSAELQMGPETAAVGGAAGCLDIVIRDKNGEIELGDPPTPGVDEGDDGMAEARHENEKERQRLAEAVKQHQIDKNSLPVQPEGEFLFFVGISSSFISIPCVGATEYQSQTRLELVKARV